jgi:sialate O-acetylesterase
VLGPVEHGAAVWRALDATSEIAGAAGATIRLLTVPQTGSVVPLETFQTAAQWQTVKLRHAA